MMDACAHGTSLLCLPSSTANPVIAYATMHEPALILAVGVWQQMRAITHAHEAARGRRMEDPSRDASSDPLVPLTAADANAETCSGGPCIRLSVNPIRRGAVPPRPIQAIHVPMREAPRGRWIYSFQSTVHVKKAGVAGQPGQRGAGAR
jgi:hypothetical protein